MMTASVTNRVYLTNLMRYACCLSVQRQNFRKHRKRLTLMKGRGSMDTENRVRIMSRDDAELLIYEERFPENAAVISFSDPEESRLTGLFPVNYDGACGHVFRVDIEDIDKETLDERGCFDDFFPEAEEAAKFIRENMKAGRDIICQCEYGVSRSAGCAAAVREFFFGDGIRVFADYRYMPNQLVFNKIYDALTKTENV